MWLLHNQTLYGFPHKLGGLPVALTKRWLPVPLIWDIRWDQPRSLNFTLVEVLQHVLGFHKESPLQKSTKEKSNPEERWIIMTSLVSSWEWKIKLLTVFRWDLFFSLCWGTMSSRNGLAVPGVFLRAQIQCDRSVGNNWCVFLTEHFVNRKPGIYFLMKKKTNKKNLVAKEWAESLAGSVHTWLSEQ